MLNYAIIYSIDGKEGSEVVNTAIVSEPPTMEVLTYNAPMPLKAFVKLLHANGVKPLNFKVNNQGVVLDEDLHRLQRLKAPSLFILLAVLKNSNGDTLGYRVFSLANGRVVNVPVNELGVLMSQVPKGGYLFQNAIVQAMKNTYRVQGFEQRPLLEIVTTRRNKKAQPVKAPVNVETVQNSKDLQRKQLSAEQQAVVDACEKDGINGQLISNPALTVEQQKILWQMAKQGAKVELFNNPSFSADSMKYYGNMVDNKDSAEFFAPMLAHPELTPAEIQELSACKVAGIDIDELIGLDAESIYYTRIQNDPNYWDYSTWQDKAISETWHAQAEDLAVLAAVKNIRKRTKQGLYRYMKID